jgi:ATP-dependent helicase HrpB
MERFRSDLERRAAPAMQTRTKASVMALLAGFPDRIARHTGSGTYQFPSGRIASLPKETRAAMSLFPSWIIAPEVDAGEREGRIFSFEVPDETEALEWLSLHAVTKTGVVYADGRSGGSAGVRKTEYTLYGKIILSEKRVEANQEDLARAWCASVRKAGFAALPWSPVSLSFLLRSRFWYQKNGKDASHLENDRLLETLEDWLLPFVPSKGSLSAGSLLDALRFLTDAGRIDREVPLRIDLPSGISRPLVYEEITPGEAPVPVLETRIQDLFGCADTPTVLGEPVLLRLLSPAHRPLQITRDLAGFWRNTWPEVIKEMKGRYPKHKWPEKPSEMSTSR